ncbi:MAG: tRNA (adenosine(37)-N6)-threonylcarbamoyltransferase complex dimerization subunit type 1 TsaB [Terriglobia bacterium]
MLILALDTTSEWGGAAVFRDEHCIAAAPHHEIATSSVSLFDDVDRLLGDAGIGFHDIELFAAASGPGSFTGIRVGLAAAQGWSHAFGKPARGVPVLDAMAEAAQAGTPRVFPVLDARRGEFYAGAFCRVASAASDLRMEFAACGEAAVLNPEGLFRYLEKAGEVAGGAIIARDADAAAQSLRAKFEAQFEWKMIGSFLVPAIATLALRAEHDRQAGSPQELSAFYVRRCDAELNWSE